MEEEDDEKGILFIQKQTERTSRFILRGKGGGGGREANPEAGWTDLFRSLIKLEIALLGGTLPRVQYYYTFIEYICCHTNS